MLELLRRPVACAAARLLPPAPSLSPLLLLSPARGLAASLPFGPSVAVGVIPKVSGKSRPGTQDLHTRPGNALVGTHLVLPESDPKKLWS